jgi:hypothetical protein
MHGVPLAYVLYASASLLFVLAVLAYCSCRGVLGLRGDKDVPLLNPLLNDCLPPTRSLASDINGNNGVAETNSFIREDEMVLLVDLNTQIDLIGSGLARLRQHAGSRGGGPQRLELRPSSAAVEALFETLERTRALSQDFAGLQAQTHKYCALFLPSSLRAAVWARLLGCAPDLCPSSEEARTMAARPPPPRHVNGDEQGSGLEVDVDGTGIQMIDQVREK